MRGIARPRETGRDRQGEKEREKEKETERDMSRLVKLHNKPISLALSALRTLNDSILTDCYQGDEC